MHYCAIACPCVPEARPVQGETGGRKQTSSLSARPEALIGSSKTLINDPGETKRNEFFSSLKKFDLGHILELKEAAVTQPTVCWERLII